MANDDQLRDLEERYEGYTVYDNAGEKIGKVDDLFVDETDREEYIGVKMGLFGLSGTTLIPMDVVRVDEQERAIEVSESKEHVKDAPNFSDDDDITPDYEDRIRRHFGLESLESSAGRGSYGRGAGAATGGAAAGGAAAAEGGSSTEDRDRMGRESYRNREDMGDESVMGSSGAGTATPSGGVRDLETSDRGGVEDESFREGYREGFREGYREGAHEGATEPGDRGDLGTSSSTIGAGATEGGARDLDRGGREREGIGSSETRDRDRGERLGSSEARNRDRGEREGEQRDEGVGTKVWRRIRS